MIEICRRIKRKYVSFWIRCADKKYKVLFMRRGSRKLDRNKRIYYIIRRYPERTGFFSNYMYVLSHMAYAREKRYVPVVDMKNYPTLYSESKLINGTKNAWEYYFCQPDDVALKAAYKSKNYILSENKFSKEGVRYLTDTYLFPLEDGVKFYYELCSKIKLENDLEKELDDESRTLQLKRRKTLGVHVRGTDMMSGEYEDHPQSLNVRDYIDMTNQFLNEDNEITQVFLATDDESVENEFRKYFEEKLCVSNAYRAKENSEAGIHYAVGCQRANHHYLLGKEVVKDAFLLSQCDKLLCGFSNVASVAIIWNNNQFERIGVLCRKEYGEKLIMEIERRENMNRDRYVIRAV